MKISKKDLKKIIASQINEAIDPRPMQDFEQNSTPAQKKALSYAKKILYDRNSLYGGMKTSSWHKLPHVALSTDLPNLITSLGPDAHFQKIQSAIHKWARDYKQSSSFPEAGRELVDAGYDAKEYIEGLKRIAAQVKGFDDEIQKADFGRDTPLIHEEMDDALSSLKLVIALLEEASVELKRGPFGGKLKRAPRS